METSLSRRELLTGGAVVSGILAVAFAGSPIVNRVRLLGCPSPTDGVELDHTEHRVDQPLVSSGTELSVISTGTDLVLIRSSDEIAALRMEEFPESTREFVNSTDFDQHFLIAVHPPDSGNSSNFHITGVKHQGEAEVHSYSCSLHRSSEDIPCGCSWIIRVGADFTPTRAAHTHEGGFGEQTIETG